jgi:GT2 family glycosyltransferase
MLLRQDVLERVGALDETFFTYYEDTDLCWRMRLQGWRVIYEPAAVVEHAHSATAVDGSAFKYFHADRNRLFMIVKNGSPRFVVRTFYGFARRAAGVDGTRGAGNPAAQRIRSQIRARVLASFALHLPEMLFKRWRVRRNRRIPDAEIEGLLYPRELWDARSG